MKLPLVISFLAIFSASLALPQSPNELWIQFESYETEEDQFYQWLAENSLADNGIALRAAIDEWAVEKKAQKIHSVLLHNRRGTLSRAQSGEEYTYPMSSSAPAYPSTLNLSGSGTRSPVIPKTPESFEWKNLGYTIEIETPEPSKATFGTINLNVSVEVTELEKLQTWPPEQGDPKFEQTKPVFYTQKIVTSLYSAVSGSVFIGTTHPRTARNPQIAKPIALNFLKLHGKKTKSEDVETFSYDTPQLKNIYSISDWIQINTTQFDQLLTDHPLTGNTSDIYTQVQQWITEGTADRYKNGIVISNQVGGKTESSSEFLAPEEYDQPKVPDQVTLGSGAIAPVPANTPAGWKVYNLGFSMETEPLFSPRDDDLIEINLKATHRELKDFVKWPNENLPPNQITFKPTFHWTNSQNRIELKNKTFTLTGTSKPEQISSATSEYEPVILHFVRADINDISGN